jgi:hypothetical protein
VKNLGPRNRIDNLELHNFKCFESLQLNFNRGSELGGAWTCLAGINGAGKSSVLQALAILTLNRSYAVELGRTRLLSMQRRGEGAGTLKIVATISDQGFLAQSTFSLEERFPNLEKPVALQKLVLGYGASRNLSPGLDSTRMSFSIELRRVLSLFEPFAPFANAEVFFRHSGEIPPNFLPFFSSVLRQIFPDELPLNPNRDSLVFSVRGASVSVEELPDGYRSSLAWLSDLCWNWSKNNPDCMDPAEVEALVLIDEIDLHLHPQLQRTLVPRLRQIFPRVQWIVTTHSPLVLGCFDKNEIILLDADSPDGVELVQRQVMGLSADQIMPKLMGAQPGGALDDQVKAAELDRSLRSSTDALIENPSGTDPLLTPSEVGSLL